MSSSSLVLKRSNYSMFGGIGDFNRKVQPRSSAERDNSQLLFTALKASSTDIANRLLDYASLDKSDCEASCILISLSNHKRTSKPKKEVIQMEQKQEVAIVKEIKEQVPVKIKINTIAAQSVITPDKPTAPILSKKEDPIMLLMAAAEVVDASDNKNSKQQQQKRSHPYHDKEYPGSNKRIRTSPPTPAPNTTTTNNTATRYNDHHSNHNSNRGTREPSDPMIVTTNNTFSRQYHSMKQNPKVKQNALHTYITYMIYNDLAHGGGPNARKNYETHSTTKYQAPPPPQQQKHDYYNEHKPSLSSSASSAATSSTINTKLTTPAGHWYKKPTAPRPPPTVHDERSILSRPLTAFLWNNDTPSTNNNPLDTNARKDMMILPPLSTVARQSNTYDRLPPV